MRHSVPQDNFKSHTDVFESFFTLCASFYEHATYCFLSNPANTLPHVLQFCVQVLDSLSTHRAAMQRCLHFLQQLLESTACIDVLAERAELHALFAQSWSEQGSGLLRQLVSNLADSSSLPPLIDSKIASVLFAAAKRFPDLTRAWIEKAVMSEYVGGSIPHVSEEVSRNATHAGEEAKPAAPRRAAPQMMSVYTRAFVGLNLRVHCCHWVCLCASCRAVACLSLLLLFVCRTR